MPAESDGTRQPAANTTPAPPPPAEGAPIEMVEQTRSADPVAPPPEGPAIQMVVARGTMNESRSQVHDD